MEFHQIFIAGMILFILYMYVENRNSDVHYEISTFDNRSYLVRNLDDKKDAANLLAKVRKNMEDLCQSLKTQYPEDDSVNTLLRKFNPDRISETEKGSKYTSYSLNKGEKIVLCLRARDNTEKLIDINTLMFVALHELAHIMTKSVGHKREFWKNFKFLLKNAIGLNMYKHEDYNNNPKKYCGITITDTPMNDNSL